MKVFNSTEADLAAARYKVTITRETAPHAGDAPAAIPYGSQKEMRKRVDAYIREHSLQRSRRSSPP